MAKLTDPEKDALEELFKLPDGYASAVFQSTPDMRRFFAEELSVNIDDDKYLHLGPSKSNRLRAFWKEAPSPQVGILIARLIERGENEFNSWGASSRPLIERCKETAARLTATVLLDERPTEEAPEDYVSSLGSRGFVISRILGSGASGRVYEAHQDSLDRLVAIKFFDNQFNTRNPLMRKRFLRESKLLAQVGSPHVPYVITHGSTKDSNTPYYVMQHVPGEPLSTLLERKGPLPEDVALSFVRQILEALSSAHQSKVIHRDVTPRNSLEHRGWIYLLDFSIGGWLDRTSETPVTTHEALGTREYAAPEQRRDASLSDERSDIFSAGVLLFELISGHARLRPDSLTKLIPRAHPDTREAIRRACAEDPADRFQTAHEFRAALPTALTGASRRGNPSAAFCGSLKCEASRWSRDKYIGPLILKECTDNNCRKCGTSVTYECAGCGAPFEGEQYCGICGRRFFAAPVCTSCGNFLAKNEIDLDTETGGCPSCKSSLPDLDLPPFENDIPF